VHGKLSGNRGLRRDKPERIGSGFQVEYNREGPRNHPQERGERRTKRFAGRREIELDRRSGRNKQFENDTAGKLSLGGYES